MLRVLASLSLVLVVFAALVGLSTSTAQADGLVVVDCDALGRPVTPAECPAYLRVKNHNVTVTIENQVARTHIDQIFVNDSEFQLEGTYVFPLPADAAISDFAMYVDGNRLEGRILDREQARQIYEDIVRRKRDPALLEYIGRNAFQARIFPIDPHTEKRVEISYSQVLKIENGLVKYVYPLSTERFSTRPLDIVSINVSLQSPQAIKAIYSPTHSVSIDRDGDFRAKIGYEDSHVKPDRDFVLYYSVSSNDVAATLLTYQGDGSSDGFFLLLVTPRVEVQQQQVIAKDVILVLDTSGSMNGDKIVQAKNALKYVLDQLQPNDRFNIITFATAIVPFADTLQPASARGEGKKFVERIAASGSTDINRALLEAMRNVDKSRPTILIFLTDGLPTVGETDADRILANVGRDAPSNVRLFSFGVGDDVNTVLLDSLSEKYRGTTAYVRPGERVDEAVSDFYAKVATPVLTDLAIDWGGIQTYDVYPYPLPDLFAGSQLVITGRYRSGGPAKITITGNLNDQKQSYAFEDLTFTRQGGDNFIAPLWATRKIGYLLSQIRLHGETKEAIDEIVSLAIRYGIVTPYTSFLIEEGADVLSPEGRLSAASKVQQQAAPTAAAPSGAGAVDNSQANQALKSANAAPPPSEGSGQLKQVADKAFILRDGIWTDTTFDPAKMTTTKYKFGTDEYFALLSQHPEWGKYFAVGDKVIVVLEGKAVEITE